MLEVTIVRSRLCEGRLVKKDGRSCVLGWVARKAGIPSQVMLEVSTFAAITEPSHCRLLPEKLRPFMGHVGGVPMWYNPSLALDVAARSDNLFLEEWTDQKEGELIRRLRGAEVELSFAERLSC